MEVARADPARGDFDEYLAGTGLADEIEAGPVRYDCALPLRLWEIRVDGAGRLFERAEHVATKRDAYETVEIQASLTFTGSR